MAEEAQDNKDFSTIASNMVSIKAPEFSEASAVGWFAVMEAQFVIKRITESSTKFYNTLAVLPPHLVANLSEEILAIADYDLLKKNIIEAHQQTKPELFEQLTSKTYMTGRPSHYLRELQTLATKAGIGQCEDLIRHKFLNALPKDISPALATQKDLTLTQLGSLADELKPMVQTIHMVGNKNFTKATSQGNYRSSKNNNIPIGLKPYSSDQRSKICRAHIYFGAAARTCKPWCKFPDKKKCKILPNSRPSSPSRQEN